MRRVLDSIYVASGVLAAVSLVGMTAVMWLNSALRQVGVFFRGADDIVAYLCAATGFLALAYTFRRGELVRVRLVIDLLPPKARRIAEIVPLGAAVFIVGYVLWASALFVYESWKLGEMGTGLLPIPIWIPQMSLVCGVFVLAVAVVDEFVVLVTGGTPAYSIAENERKASVDHLIEVP